MFHKCRALRAVYVSMTQVVDMSMRIASVWMWMVTLLFIGLQ